MLSEDLSDVGSLLFIVILNMLSIWTYLTIDLSKFSKREKRLLAFYAGLFLIWVTGLSYIIFDITRGFPRYITATALIIFFTIVSSTVVAIYLVRDYKKNKKSDERE